MTDFADGPLMLPDDVVAWNSESLSAEIDGEIVALDVEKGACYGLDPVGARIWAIVQTPAPLSTLLAILTSEFEVDPETCRRDVLELLTDLKAEGLVTVTPGASRPESEA